MNRDDDDSTNTLVPSPNGLTLRSNKIRIEVIQGPQERTTRELPGPAVRIGSGADCDFRVDDPTVSRHHLTLRIERNKIRILDAGSLNGTTVDGVQVRDGYARPDSCITIGKTVFRLLMVNTIVELPLFPGDRFGDMLGRSIAMRAVFALLERAAATDATVLIEGETGTGKEVAARAIHEASPRSKGPFIVLDCSTISQELAESELFGHVKGSFTGATMDRPGIFEEADGGTVFLDEIGELPYSLQPKLLRVLESMEVRRVGANRPKRFDVRVVAATNRPLSRAVDLGAFREDLYYRLAVVPVRLPPLSERSEDIPMLVRHFEKELSTRMRSKHPLSQEVIDKFSGLTWNGNVRELRNAVARALAFGAGEGSKSNDGREPDVQSLGIRLDEPLLHGRDRMAQAYEKHYLRLMLQKTDGNVSRAAELAGVGRKFVQMAMKRYGLRGDLES
ncbi:sigma 54-interacting transcriptional regulator [Polyangium jinanense]|uniref:Sigma 54-dependent Fis family transcriptional regulator n=1 Tax=Polyangium jinanense TaxID=2829994 RepID=A0A9X3XFC6_9BACT|nr:sigma 54-interacting transcriptional regulator [Polyangium jinanense]MDC3962092.1 sigma 54-dependent Fis family transcriptional regulator [Polyangium jinanense]MDC3988375.1 sigma 54-dependent Fis family transcriptional regulator [Polyangium jinanense]